MTSEDYIYLIASMSKKEAPLAWDKGGKGVVMGWVEAMRRKANV